MKKSHWLAVAMFVFSLAPQAARADEASRIALAEEVLELNGSLDTMRAAIDGMKPSMRANLQQAGVTGEDAERYIEIYIEEFHADMPRIIQVIAVSYAGAYSETELQDIATFFRTPAGQAVRRNTPELVQIAQQVGMAAGVDIDRRAAARFLAEKERGPSPS
jgi:hypothetical protein